jgi:hypothetical protein
MTELLHAYLFRVKKSVLFWILVGCFAFYVFINLVVLYRDNANTYQYYSSNGSFTLTFYQSLIGFYLTGGTLSQILTVGSPIGPFSLLGILSFIFVLNFFEEDWGNRTFRLPILSGRKRSEIYFSALIFGLGIYLFFLAIYTFIILGIGGLFNHTILPYMAGMALAGNDAFYSVMMPILNCLAWMAFAIFLVMSIKGKKLPLAIFVLVFVFSFVFALILYATGGTHPQTGDPISYYPFNEFLSFYQCYKAGTPISNPTMGIIGIDEAVEMFRDTTSGSSYTFINSRAISGRANILFVKSLVSFVVVFVGSTLLGLHLFKKGDLR